LFPEHLSGTFVVVERRDLQLLPACVEAQIEAADVTAVRVT
jgi:hypothetical protein